MATAPVNPDAPITRSEKVTEHSRNFEAGILPEPRVESAEDVLQLIERNVPDLLHMLMEVTRGENVPPSPRDHIVDGVLLEVYFILMSAGRALRTGEWPRWEVSKQSPDSLRRLCQEFRDNEEVTAESLRAVLDLMVRGMEAEEREAAR